MERLLLAVNRKSFSNDTRSFVSNRSVKSLGRPHITNLEMFNFLTDWEDKVLRSLDQPQFMPGESSSFSWRWYFSGALPSHHWLLCYLLRLNLLSSSLLLLSFSGLSSLSLLRQSLFDLEYFIFGVPTIFFLSAFVLHRNFNIPQWIQCFSQTESF